MATMEIFQSVFGQAAVTNGSCTGSWEHKIGTKMDNKLVISDFHMQYG